MNPSLPGLRAALAVLCARQLWARWAREAYDRKQRLDLARSVGEALFDFIVSPNCRCVLPPPAKWRRSSRRPKR